MFRSVGTQQLYVSIDMTSGCLYIGGVLLQLLLLPLLALLSLLPLLPLPLLLPPQLKYNTHGIYKFLNKFIRTHGRHNSLWKEATTFFVSQKCYLRPEVA